MYVNDIGAAGSRTTINELGKNLRQMEKEKGVTFNVEKTNIMLIGKAKNETEMDIQLKNGLVREVEEYKFLGNWLNKKGNMDRQIEELEKKAEGIIVEIKRITKEEDLGMLSTDARLLIYERTAVPSLTNNLECWTKIGKKEMERLEKIQGRMLKRLLKVPESTSTWGVLKETGIWSVEMQIVYQRLMLYQNLLASDDERLGRRIIEAEEETVYAGWATETERIAGVIEIDIGEVHNLTKKAWKKKVKEKIKLALEKQSKRKEDSSKQIRY